MSMGSKIAKSGLIAGLLAAVWAAKFESGVLAQHDRHHTHAPASAKNLKNPLAAN